MMRSTLGRGLVSTLAAMTAAIVIPLASAGAHPSATGKPVAVTGSVGHVRGISAELEGTVTPGTQTTSYYFQYGPTAAFGSQTTPGNLPPGSARVKVGQTVTGLLPGYHYRLIATSAAGSSTGKERIYTAKALKISFTLAKPTAPTVYGSPLAITGSLAGPTNAHREIVLQESPYPFLAPFATLGTPIFTNAAGGFVLPVASLTSSTQFRVSTVDPRPIYSPVVTEQVAVKVTLKVRTSARKGLVRLYGTISPAEPGARVYFQLRKAVRPGGKSENTTRFATQFTTAVKRATKTSSRFSTIVEVAHGGRYRAYVQVKNKGPLVAGASTTVVLAAAPTAKKH